MLTRFEPTWRRRAALIMVPITLVTAVATGLLLSGCFYASASPYPTVHPTVTATTAFLSPIPSRATAHPLNPFPDRRESVDSVLPDSDPSTVALPLIDNCACTCPPTPTPAAAPTAATLVYNCQGLITSTAWLTTTFGAVTWTTGSGAGLTTIAPCCQRDCPAVLVVHVEDELGHPVGGVTVVLHWPDAPLLPEPLRNCGLDRGIYGPTNAGGDIGFGLGGGAYYWPPAGGPHTIWIPTEGSGSCLSGLGMIAATNHWHLDSAWRLQASPSVAGSAALGDWGYTPGTLVYPATVNGREMYVIQWPSH